MCTWISAQNGQMAVIQCMLKHTCFTCMYYNLQLNYQLTQYTSTIDNHRNEDDALLEILLAYVY